MLHVHLMTALEGLYTDRSGRAGRPAGAPCHAWRGLGQGRDLWPPGRAKAIERSALREAAEAFEQALAALQHLPESRATRQAGH